ncbi:hypothetical protein [Actinomadura macra]|uniref:hypothetical protein n=1 Tax=Actinomadura macra TaxID=46164 RepID=UPI000A444157|nr:hypothetical protein [Actinomadura macra]
MATEPIHPTPDPSERPARPGETCTCGHPAVLVYITTNFGEVPYCGVPRGAVPPTQRDEIGDGR